MREILFRAWDSHRKEMCYEIDVYQNADGIENDFWWTGQWRFESGDKSSFFDNKVKGNALMQYTGLKDKNGNKIFEKDILDNGTSKWIVKIGIFQDEKSYEKLCGVYVQESKGKNRIYRLLTNNTEDVIIGDIYTTPELIKEPIKVNG